MKVLDTLPKLREFSMDVNPCSSDASFNYEVILRYPKLRMLNDESIRELDKDVAVQYFNLKGIEVPCPVDQR